MKRKIILLFLLTCFCVNVKANETEDYLEEISEHLKTMENTIFLQNHPIGSIYETTNNDENTIEKIHELYGGTWEVYGNDKVLRGTTDTAEQTGGNTNIKINSNQIPSLNFGGSTSAKTVSSSSCNTCNGIGVSGPTNYVTRNTTTNGNHTHAFSKSGTAIVLGANTAGGAGTSYGFETGDGWWHNRKKNIGTLANNGNHNHTFPDYYLNKVSGVASHNHSVTSASQTIASTYTNNNQASVNVLDPYITVYRYKRVS